MQTRLPLTEQDARDIYAILVEKAGAPDPEWGYEQFLRAETREFCTEYRFGGALGMGGKLWRNAGRLYISCYSEDETKKLTKMIAATNEALAAFLAAHPSAEERYSND